MFRKYLIIWITTFFCVGKIPKAPGTFGSLATVMVTYGGALLLGQTMLEMMLTHWRGVLLLLVGIYSVGVWAGKGYETLVQKHDPKEMVSDEVLGQLLTYMLAACAVSVLNIPITPMLDWVVVIAGFGLFRLFDITKPSLVGFADKRIHNVHGVMLDDVFAGIFAGLCLWPIIWCINMWQ